MLFYALVSMGARFRMQHNSVSSTARGSFLLEFTKNEPHPQLTELSLGLTREVTLDGPQGYFPPHADALPHNNDDSTYSLTP